MANLKNRLILRQGLRAGVVAGIISQGTAIGLESALWPSKQENDDMCAKFETIPVSKPDPVRVLISMAKLADGNRILPCGSKKEFKDCISEPVPGVIMLWYNVGETTKVQYISYDQKIVL